jgi:hypothetical protein
VGLIRSLARTACTPEATRVLRVVGVVAVDDLPAPVVTFLNVIGVDWPYINEDAVTQFASLARDFAQAVQTTHQNATAAIHGIARGYQGASTRKSPESFKRNFAEELSESATRDVDTALADMKDSVRYTLRLPGEGTAYTDGVNTALRRFQDAGFDNVKFKNTWDQDDYKGINSFWRDPQTGARVRDAVPHPRGLRREDGHPRAVRAGQDSRRARGQDPRAQGGTESDLRHGSKAYRRHRYRAARKIEW